MRLPIEVHEDLLCAHSPYFKSLLQASRKPIDSPVDCCVCETPLLISEDNIAYCKSCGQNMHTQCIDQWLERNAKCPLCRFIWTREDQHIKVTIPGLDREGFENWAKCLYRSKLPVLKEEIPDAEIFDRHLIRLIRASSAAKNIKDLTFQDAVIAQIALDIEKHNLLPGLLVIQYLFSEMEKESDFAVMRAFVIDVYALRWSAGDETFWLGNYDLHGVAEFMSCLLTAQSKAKELTLTGTALPGIDEIIKKHMVSKIVPEHLRGSSTIGRVFDEKSPSSDDEDSQENEQMTMPLMKIPGFDILIPEDRRV